MKSHQELNDLFEIQSLGYRFADAANRGDHAGFAALWADDGVWRIGEPINVSFESRKVISEAIGRMLGLWDFFVQMPHAPVIELNGDTAKARWTVSEVARTRDRTRGNFNLSLYHDDLVRVRGEWLFRSRVYETLYSDESPLTGVAFGSPGATRAPGR